MGFGLCILLISLGAFVVLAQYYSQMMGWRGEVEQMYYTTHSPMYESAMNALSTLSPYANQAADIIRDYGWIFGIGWLASSLRQIGGAASKMSQVRDASESAYYGMQTFEVVPQYLICGMGIGALLIIVGVVLVARARRRAAS